MSVSDRSNDVSAEILIDWSPEVGIAFEVTQAWLPMVVLEGVEVRVTESRGLGILERFVIEALLALEVLRASDLQEIVSLPTELGSWLLASLKQKDLATVEDGTFRPRVQQCQEALANRGIEESRTRLLDLVWFPESDEVVALADGPRFFRSLSGLRPRKRWPIPAVWQDRSLAVVLGASLKGGRIYGSGAQGIQGVVDARLIQDDTFPAYICTASVPLKDDGPWQLLVRSPANSRSDQNAGRPEDKFEVVVPPLPKLIERWRNRISVSRRAAKESLDLEWDLMNAPENGDEFRAILNGEQAKELAKGHLLRDVTGVLLRIADEMECVLPLGCGPGDEAAKALFDLDSQVRQVLLQSVEGAPLNGRATEAVRERLWQLKLFKALYFARESEDFPS